jgi:hypothetical protein
LSACKVVYVTYEIDTIQLGDSGAETQPLDNAPNLLGAILTVARLRPIENESRSIMSPSPFIILRHG